MKFWEDVESAIIANVGAGVLFVLSYVAIQWFLQVTDIEIVRC